MSVNERISIEKVQEVLEGSSDLAIDSIDEFNKGIDHIIRLIKDSFLLYTNGSYSSSYFLSIIVIEEVAKLHMAIFITPNQGRKRDKLYDHRTKEIIGCNFTVTMGERLIQAIGTAEIEKICEMAYSGNMKNSREKALYFSGSNGRLVLPNELFSQEETKSILLFAIESFDDNLVGYTSYSIERSMETDRIFDDICSIK